MKKRIIAGASVLLCAGLVIGALYGTGNFTTRADSSRLYGVQQIVNDLGTDDFEVLEVVPDEAYASMGYYVSNSEPGIAAELLQTTASESERKTLVNTLYSRLMTDGILKQNPSIQYDEQIYTPDDIEEWTVIDYYTNNNGYAEERTGSYVLATSKNLDTGDYYYSPELTVNVSVESVTEVNSNVITGDALATYSLGAGDTIRVAISVTNGRSFELQNIPVSLNGSRVENFTIVSLGDMERGTVYADYLVQATDSVLEFSATAKTDNSAANVYSSNTLRINAASVSDVSGISINPTVTKVVQADGAEIAGMDLDSYVFENGDLVSSSVVLVSDTKVSDISVYSEKAATGLVADHAWLTWNQDVNDQKWYATFMYDYLYTDAADVLTAKQFVGGGITTEAATNVMYPDNFVLNPGVSTSPYIWVDDANGTTTNVAINKLYYRTSVQSTDLFAQDVFGLNPDIEDQAELIKHISVQSMTISELEEALNNNQLSLDSVDLLYISNSSVFGDMNAYPEVMGYSASNDIHAETEQLLYEYAVNAGLPTIVDATLLSSTAPQMKTLAQSILNAAALIADSTYTSPSTNYSMPSNTNGLAAQNVFVTTGGTLVTNTLRTQLFEYKSNRNADGENILKGMKSIVEEIQTDNFYNAANGESYTEEYSVNSYGVETVKVSKATIIKYILNFADRRVLLYKDSIRVLDLEPTKYSTLSETKIRQWLGINGDPSAKLQNIEIIQMSTSEFIGKLEDLIENYDMIYVGSCIGPSGADGAMYQSNNNTVYNDTDMNKLIYTHVGDLVQIKMIETSKHCSTGFKGILDVYKKDALDHIQTRYSGNDITEDKYNELINYANSGYPVVFDEKFFTGTSVNTTYIDDSSYLCKFMKYCMGEAGLTTTLSEEQAIQKYGSTQACVADGYSESVVTTTTSGGYRLENVIYGAANGAGLETDRLYCLVGSDTNDFKSGLAYDIAGDDDNIVRVADDVSLDVGKAIDSRYVWRLTSDGKLQNVLTQKYLNVPYVVDWEPSIMSDSGSTFVTSYDGDSNTWTIKSRRGTEDWYLFCDCTVHRVSDLVNGGYVGNFWSVYPVSELTVTNIIRSYTKTTGGTEALNNAMKTSGTYTINKLVKYINMPRLNLVMTSVPTKYESTTNNGVLADISWLDVSQGHYLRYEFEFSNTSESTGKSSKYSVNLYIDINADGQYLDTELIDSLDVRETNTGKIVDANNLQSGVRYSVSRELPDSYVGLLPWKLKVSLNEENGASAKVHASAIGYTAIKPESVKKIKVLQVMMSNDDTKNVNLRTNDTFKPLINNLRTQKLYDLDITAISTDDLDNQAASYASANAFYNGYLKQYHMLIFGFSDMYDDISNDKALNGVLEFIDAGKSVMFAHDTTSFSNGYGSSAERAWSQKINALVRSEMGMDRYGVTDIAELETKSANYTMDSALASAIVNNNKDTASKPTTIGTGDTYYEVQGFTDTFIARYLAFDDGVDGKKKYFLNTNTTDNKVGSVSQVNQGQITCYPYNVNIDGGITTRAPYGSNSSYYVEDLNKLSVATTHCQYYQLDYNYDTNNDGTNDLVVWYALAGGIYDNLPNDVRNSYYLYSVGNVMYTGMGHDAPNVSDREAQLFINAIIASYTAGTQDPSVTIVKDTNSKNSVLEVVYRTFDEDVSSSGSLTDDPNASEEYENFAFYVNDVNVIQGRKLIDVWYCHEVSQSAYNAAVAAAGSAKAAENAGYFVAIENGVTYYLKAFSADSSSSDYIGYVLQNYQNRVGNNVLVGAKVKASWIDSALVNSGEKDENKAYVANNEQYYINPARIWIAARTTLDYSSTNKEDEVTNVVFDNVTFKKRTLTNLD